MDGGWGWRCLNSDFVSDRISSMWIGDGTSIVPLVGFSDGPDYERPGVIDLMRPILIKFTKVKRWKSELSLRVGERRLG